MMMAANLSPLLHLKEGVMKEEEKSKGKYRCRLQIKFHPRAVLPLVFRLLKCLLMRSLELISVMRKTLKSMHKRVRKNIFRLPTQISLSQSRKNKQVKLSCMKKIILIIQ